MISKKERTSFLKSKSSEKFETLTILIVIKLISSSIICKIGSKTFKKSLKITVLVKQWEYKHFFIKNRIFPISLNNKIFSEGSFAFFYTKINYEKISYFLLVLCYLLAYLL